MSVYCTHVAIRIYFIQKRRNLIMKKKCIRSIIALYSITVIFFYRIPIYSSLLCYMILKIILYKNNSVQPCHIAIIYSIITE